MIILTRNINKCEGQLTDPLISHASYELPKPNSWDNIMMYNKYLYVYMICLRYYYAINMISRKINDFVIFFVKK